MRKFISKDIKFMSARKVFYIISIVLVAASIISLGVRGLNLGIEFIGGTSIDFQQTGDITVEQMREAFVNAGEDSPVVQSTVENGEAGILVRTSETSPDAAASIANDAAEALGLSTDSFEVTTIGPEWGTNVMQKSLLAFVVSIAVIIVYISIRFEYKMSLTAILALFHDLIIVVGVYSITGYEITPNVIAALLTILGYSLYDTVVVFHRINENANPAMHHSYMWTANHSINEVFIRTINTTVTSLIPVICMFAFGGATLKDFAFAMILGLVLGSYSSIAVATPIFATWKTREPAYARLAKKYGEA